MKIKNLLLTTHYSLFTILTIFSLSISVNAAVFDHEMKLEEISKKLPAIESTKCKFYQEKIVSGMMLKSSGDFEFEKDKGVTFYTTYPIKSTTSYNSKDYRQINNVITAISNKSYSKLEKDFRFFFEGDVKNWDLALLPKTDSKAYNYLKSIEIKGAGSKVEQIIILTCDKTETKIRFQ